MFKRETAIKHQREAAFTAKMAEPAIRLAQEAVVSGTAPPSQLVARAEQLKEYRADYLRSLDQAKYIMSRSKEADKQELITAWEEDAAKFLVDLGETIVLLSTRQLPDRSADDRSEPLRRVTFRPLDRDNVNLWFAQFEQLLQAMKIVSETCRYAALTSVLSEDEAQALEEITMASPPLQHPFTDAKALLLQKYALTTCQRLDRWLAISGLEEGQKPSDLLAKLRQTAGALATEDIQKWKLLRCVSSGLDTTHLEADFDALSLT